MFRKIPFVAAALLAIPLILLSLSTPQQTPAQSEPDVAAYFKQATSYYRAGEYEKARQLYQYVLDNWPNDPDYAIWSQTIAALSNIDLGKPEAAQAAIDNLLTEFSGHEHIAEVVHHIAYHYLTLKEYEKAKQLYQYVLDHWPEHNDCAIWSQTGVAMSNISLGEAQAAQAAVDKLLTQFSGNEHMAEEVHHLAWHCRYQAGNHQKAVQFYQYVLDHWPEDDKYAIWSQSGLALSYVDLGNTQAAEAAIDKLLTDFSGNERIAEEVHHITYHYRELKEYEKAKQLYQYVLDHWPNDNPYTTLSQAGIVMANIALGNDPNSQAAFNTLMADFKNHPDFPLAISRIEEQYYMKIWENEPPYSEDYYINPLQVWETVISQLPYFFCPDPDLYYFIACCYYQLGEYHSAIEYYTIVLDNWPDYYQAFGALSLIEDCCKGLIKEGAIYEEEADTRIEQMFNEIIENSPRSTSAKFACMKLANGHLEKGRWADAAWYFELFRQNFPDDPAVGDVVYDLGRAYEAMGETTLAIQVYEEFLQTHPEDGRIRLRLEQLKAENK